MEKGLILLASLLLAHHSAISSSQPAQKSTSEKTEQKDTAKKETDANHKEKTVQIRVVCPNNCTQSSCFVDVAESISFTNLIECVAVATEKSSGSFSMYVSGSTLKNDNFSLSNLLIKDSFIKAYAPIIVRNNPNTTDTKKQE